MINCLHTKRGRFQVVASKSSLCIFSLFFVAACSPVSGLQISKNTFVGKSSYRPSEDEDFDHHGVCDASGVDGSEFNGIVNGKKLGLNNLFSSRIVNLYFKSDDDYDICTGALLPGNVVLTAAHCISELPQNMKVVFLNDLNCDVTMSGPQTRLVDKAFINPGYHGATTNSDYDLGMLHFVGSIPAGYQSFGFPKGLQDTSAIKKIVMAGFGATEGINRTSPGVLRITSLLADRVSKSTQMPLSWTVDQHDTGICYGDSGGPLMTFVGGQLELIGVASTVFTMDASQTDDCSGGSTFVDIHQGEHQTWLADTYQKLHD